MLGHAKQIATALEPGEDMVQPAPARCDLGAALESGELLLTAKVQASANLACKMATLVGSTLWLRRVVRSKQQVSY